MTPGTPFSPLRRFRGALIPEALLRLFDLPLAAKVLWSVLARCCGDKSQCWPGQDWLARECRMSIRTVQRHLALLEAAKLLRRTRNGLQRSNTYELLWHDLLGKQGVLCEEPSTRQVVASGHDKLLRRHLISERGKGKRVNPSPTPSDGPKQQRMDPAPKPEPRKLPVWWTEATVDDINRLRRVMWEYQALNPELAATPAVVKRVLDRAYRSGLNATGAAHVLHLAHQRIVRSPALTPETPGWYLGVVDTEARRLRERRPLAHRTPVPAHSPLREPARFVEQPGARDDGAFRKPPVAEFAGAIAALAAARRMR